MTLTKTQERTLLLLGKSERGAMLDGGQFSVTDFNDLRNGKWKEYPVSFATICELQNKGMVRIYGQKRHSLIFAELTELGKLERSKLTPPPPPTDTPHKSAE